MIFLIATVKSSPLRFAEVSSIDPEGVRKAGNKVVSVCFLWLGGSFFPFAASEHGLLPILVGWHGDPFSVVTVRDPVLPRYFPNLLYLPLVFLSEDVLVDAASALWLFVFLLLPISCYLGEEEGCACEQF